MENCGQPMYQDRVVNSSNETAGLVRAPLPNPIPVKYAIIIEPLDYGYIVRIGCKVIAIESKEKVIEKLTAYLINPTGTEEKFNSGKLFN